jgi:hypothetical protein
MRSGYATPAGAGTFRRGSHIPLLYLGVRRWLRHTARLGCEARETKRPRPLGVKRYSRQREAPKGSENERS